MNDELTSRDKVILLATVDGKSVNDYDHEFYEAMCKNKPVPVEELDDKVRRAILRFTMNGKGPASQEDNGGFVMMGFVHGYLVGQKLKRNILRK